MFKKPPYKILSIFVWMWCSGQVVRTWKDAALYKVDGANGLCCLQSHRNDLNSLWQTHSIPTTIPAVLWHPNRNSLVSNGSFIKFDIFLVEIWGLIFCLDSGKSTWSLETPGCTRKACLWQTMKRLFTMDVLSLWPREQSFLTSNWHFWQMTQMSDKCLLCKY